MTHASLFSGIGGFDLAAEWAGWQNLFHCEWNPFGQKVLKHHFPNSISYNDITKTDFTIHRGQVDILTGGFPCQPYSSAGKRLGKEDERHLWPEMLRTIREVQPRWVVGENVRGLTNWNGGMVFDEVQSDLENQGYEVTPYLLPAAAVNAPHRRDRIWFVAYSESIRWNGRGSEHRENINANSNRICEHGQEQCSMQCEFERPCKKSNVANTNCNGFNQCNGEHEINSSQGRKYAFNNIEQNDIKHTKNIGQEYALENRELEGRRFGQSNQRTTWDSFPSQSPICGGDDGLPRELDNITFSKWRQESIKAYGNAIVPQVAFQIFKAINQYEAL
jgi:DNA (cytosine-5)-methyltransferase 1